MLAFDRRDLVALLESRPRMGHSVMKSLSFIIARRLRHTQELWLREVQLSLDQRYR